MEFTVTKDVFNKGIGRTQSIVEKKTTLPILSNVLIEAKEDFIDIIATDLEVGTKGRYEASVKEEGSITIGAKKLFEIVRELPDEEIHFKAMDNNWAKVTCGNAEFQLVGLSAGDFPILPSFEEEDFAILPSAMRAMKALSSFILAFSSSAGLPTWESTARVNMAPGAIAFTLIPCGPNSLARLLVSINTPPLDAS